MESTLYKSIEFDFDFDESISWADLVESEEDEKEEEENKKTEHPGFNEINNAGLQYPLITLQLFAFALCLEENGESPEIYFPGFPRKTGEFLSEAILRTVRDGKWLKIGEKSHKDSDSGCYKAYKDHYCQGKSCAMCKGKEILFHPCGNCSKQRHKTSCKNCIRDKNNILRKLCSICVKKHIQRNKNRYDNSCTQCINGYIGTTERRLCPHIIPKKNCRKCKGMGGIIVKCTGSCPLMHYTTKHPKNNSLVQRCVCRRGHRLGDCQRGHQIIKYCLKCGKEHPHINRLEVLTYKERVNNRK